MFGRAKIAGIAWLALIAVTGCTGTSGLGSLEQALGGSPGALDDDTIVSGLKDALRVGTEKTVALTSAADGFLGNDRIRIPVPDALETPASVLRKIGLGSQVDDLEVAMNRAAERAAGEATPVFLDAISSMTIRDARGILDGGDTAATEYFRKTTSAPLTERFTPIVDQAMREVGLVKLYDQLVSRYSAIPFADNWPPLDMTQYVTGKGLDGLFTVLGQQETLIRTDPSARVNDLLKQVFGR